MIRFARGHATFVGGHGLLAAAFLSLQISPAASADSFPADPAELQVVVFRSAQTGDLATMTGLLDHGFDIDIRDETGQTPLITAALAGQDDIARLLIDNNADVMARTGNGMTALHAAAYVGDLAIAEMLIAHGAEVNDQANVAGITPLHAAAEEDHADVAAELLKAGADVALVEVNGYTAGSRAGWREHWDIVRLLMRAGDTCQPEALAGPWLYEKCTHLDLNASN
jgi:uncharacterized protein